MEHFSGLMVATSRVLSRMVSCTVKETMFGRTADDTKVNTDSIRSTGRAPTRTLTAASTEESGLMACNTGLAVSSMLNRPTNAKVTGPLVSSSSGLRRHSEMAPFSFLLPVSP